MNLPQQERYLEGDLEREIISNLQTFLLELGKGFAFIGRQYKVTLGGRHFFVDLVFYHCILKCFVLIDLKRGEIDHGDIGQMNLYLNYFAEEENTEGDNPPIGIVLGAYKDEVLVKYATTGLANQLFVSKYQLTSPMRRLCVTKCKESWNKNKTFNISKFDIRVHKIRMFFITKYELHKLLLQKV